MYDLYDLCDLYDLYDLYDLCDRYDLYGLVYVAGWKPYSLHDLAHVSWGGSALCRCCSTALMAGEEPDDLDYISVDDLDGVDDISVHDLSWVGKVRPNKDM